MGKKLRRRWTLKCDLCKKNHAHLHLTRIINGKPYAVHICAQCAKEKGVNNPAAAVPLENILAGSEAAAPVTPRDQQKSKNVVCARCGKTYQNFRDSGKLGCGECYATFEELLIPLLERIQRDTRHIGKVPSRKVESLEIAKGILTLREELSQAVTREDFERAAGLRDQIRQLEEKKQKTEKELLRGGGFKPGPPGAEPERDSFLSSRQRRGTRQDRPDDFECFTGQ
jgi:protein arginine kinase activator